MSGRLTTHVLELSAGRPAQGMKVALFRLQGEGEAPVKLNVAVTNSDGRLDAPLLNGEAMMTGTYELLFYVGDYFRAIGFGTEAPMFLETVPVRFQITGADGHYHVPLLVAPGGYSTYRGS